MKPRRPDSAKSQLTKVTQDSQPSKKDLNSSKFSETFSSGVSSIHEKGDEFKQYVTQKDKDPRFKHLKSKLEVIQQKTYQPDTSKTSFKPFQRKKDKTTEKNSNKKIEEKQEKSQKEDEQLSLSRGFAEKNKQKMNSLKLATIQKKQEDEKAKETIKTKIKFDAFKINKPGEKKELKKGPTQPKKEQNKNGNEQRLAVKRQQLSAEQKSEKQLKEQEERKKAIRLNEYRNIERYVNEMQARNILMFPRNYDQVVNNTSANLEELEKIDLNDFMDEPTEGDYESLKAKINKMDHQLEADESIDLQSVIGNSQNTEELQKEENDNNSQIYASMSASDIRKRNAFMTEVFAGKISKKDIERMQEMDKTSMRMYKIEHEKDEEDVEFTEINMVKRQTNRVMQRNRLEAVGQLYRDCDYLSQEHKKRLEELLNGDIGESPFEVNEIEAMQRKRIDESIRMYREMAGSEDLSSDIFNEESLPKDPQNRKNAEQKILKERVASVNSRLAEVDKIVVTKAKIEALMKKFEHTRTSSNYQLICEQNQQKFQEEMRTLAEAETMLEHLSHTQDVDMMIKEIQEKYKQLQQEIKRFNEMDAKELMRLQKQRLKGKMREVQQVERQTEQIGPQIDQIQRIKREIEERLKVYDEIQQVQLPELKCDGYKQQETLQDLDVLITKKWQANAHQSKQQ